MIITSGGRQPKYQQITLTSKEPEAHRESSEKPSARKQVYGSSLRCSALLELPNIPLLLGEDDPKQCPRVTRQLGIDQFDCSYGERE